MHLIAGGMKYRVRGEVGGIFCSKSEYDRLYLRFLFLMKKTQKNKPKDPQPPSFGFGVGGILEKGVQFLSPISLMGRAGSGCHCSGGPMISSPTKPIKL